MTPQQQRVLIVVKPVLTESPLDRTKDEGPRIPRLEIELVAWCCVSLEEAKVLKMANKAFHAVKVGFANEIGEWVPGCQSTATRQWVWFVPTQNLTFHQRSLSPGLPKDLRSRTMTARRLGVESPILEGILPSNRLST